MSKPDKSHRAYAGINLEADLQQLFALALQSLQAGRLNAAEARFREILAKAPQHAETLNNIGLLNYQKGAFDRANEYLSKAIAVDASNPLYVNNLGLVRKAEGRLDEAVTCYRKAIELWPGYPEAHFNLGVTLQDQGKLDEAAEVYVKATTLKPDYTKAHHNLATVLMKQGRLEEAVQAYTEALSGADPQMAETYNNLGNVLRKLGRPTEAADELRKSIAIKPGYAEGYYNLGIALLLQGQIAEARECFREVLTRDPQDPLGYSGLGDAHAAEGQHEAAIENYQKAISLEGNCTPAYVGLAKAKKFSMEDSELISGIEHFLTLQENDNEAQRVLHFALGKIYDDCGSYDKAFTHYQNANALKRSQVVFDGQTHVAEVSALINTYTSELFAHHAGHGANSELPVFIVGTPRSGTTLLEQILAAHPRVHGAGELRFITEFVQALPKRLDKSEAYPECLRFLTADLISELAEAYLENLRSYCGDGKVLRVTDKMPGNFYHIGLISILFPRARIIHCRRDPLDACLSIYFQASNTGNAYSYDLADLSVFYRQYRRLMAHWRSVLPGRLIEVDYEELVNHQEVVSRRLVAQCGLEWDDACLSFYQHRRPVLTVSGWQVRQPIYKTAVQRWKHYEKHLGPLKRALGDQQG